jgi:hypothetical protein
MESITEKEVPMGTNRIRAIDSALAGLPTEHLAQAITSKTDTVVIRKVTDGQHSEKTLQDGTLRKSRTHLHRTSEWTDKNPIVEIEFDFTGVSHRDLCILATEEVRLGIVTDYFKECQDAEKAIPGRIVFDIGKCVAERKAAALEKHDAAGEKVRRKAAQPLTTERVVADVTTLAPHATAEELELIRKILERK